MDKQDSSDAKNYGSLEYWKSRPPEELLEVFSNELRGRLSSIKGWVEILRIEDMKAVHPQALDSIFSIVEYIEGHNREIKEYLDELKKKS